MCVPFSIGLVAVLPVNRWVAEGLIPWAAGLEGVDLDDLRGAGALQLLRPVVYRLRPHKPEVLI